MPSDSRDPLARDATGRDRRLGCVIDYVGYNVARSAEDNRVGTFWQFDPDGLVAPSGLVVLLELGSKAADVDADHTQPGI
jgi:hypothetical protein